MSNCGIGTIREKAEIDSRNESQLAEGKIEREKETRIIEKTNERLKELVPDDNLYEAMENFLLGDPENQIPQLGVPAEILANGDEESNKGEDLMARAKFETSAKVALYKQEPSMVKKSLELAIKVTNPNDKHARMQTTILDNLNQVIRIARDYYKTKEKVTAGVNSSVSADTAEVKK